MAENAAMSGAEGLVVRRASRDDCEAMCGIYNAALIERWLGATEALAIVLETTGEVALEVGVPIQLRFA
jgi:hypothetical protein